MYASFLRISGALYPDLFEQPVLNEFFGNLLIINPYFLPLAVAVKFKLVFGLEKVKLFGVKE
jgi:hypothetical protein